MRAEVASQLATFRRLVGRDPTHLDSHQHVHRTEPAHSILLQLAAELSVPLRQFNADVRYQGAFYGRTSEGAPLAGAISREGLLDILANLSPGVTELGCHPGYADDLDGIYIAERAEELKVLCDPTIRSAIEAMGIRLRSFSPETNSPERQRRRWLPRWLTSPRTFRRR